MILLRTSEGSGTCFIRTDQLDGETDWKLRLAITDTQQMNIDADVTQIDATIYAEPPSKQINAFIGKYTRVRLINAKKSFGQHNDFL